MGGGRFAEIRRQLRRAVNPARPTIKSGACQPPDPLRLRLCVIAGEILIHWKRGGPGHIFREWRQLCDAIAAPSTDALKKSSWYRIRVLIPLDVAHYSGMISPTVPI
jgi:hypothetical protein